MPRAMWWLNRIPVLLIGVLLVSAACQMDGQLPAAPSPLPATRTPRPTFTPIATFPVPRSTLTPTPTLRAEPPLGEAWNVAPGTPTATPTAQIPFVPSVPSVPPVPQSSPTPQFPVLGRLIIPKLKLDAAILTVPIANGEWDVQRVVQEVGWLEGTARLGERGNAGLAGHVSLKCCGDGPFRWLETLSPGDQVVVQTGERTYRYKVVETRVVPPTAVDVLSPTEEATLTLITCTEWDFLKGEYDKRFVVIARGETR